MATSRAVSKEPVISSPGNVADTVKYRLSCDRCQNNKVRCSQDKPSCKRCTQRRVICVYSPLRRIGRPKKHTGENAGFNEPRSLPFTNNVASTSSLSPGNSTIFDTVTSATSTSLDESGGCQSDFSIADIPMTDGDDAHTTAPSQPLDLSLDGTDGETCASVSMSRRTPEPHLASGADCYVAILTRTAKLEQSLVRTVLYPSIDLVLEAERDFFALRHRLFICTGHSFAPTHDLSANLQQNIDNSDQPCLASDRPVLLGIALLAERVVGMLENMFRLAALSAHNNDKANQELIWLATGTPAGPSPSARRLQRSCRSLMPAPCIWPVVETDRDVRIGDFVLDGQAKSQAMRRLLRRRARRMLSELRALESASKTRRKGEMERNSRQLLGGPLHWGGSGGLLEDSADALVDDLIRRVEALQGAMALTRNDGMT